MHENDLYETGNKLYEKMELRLLTKLNMNAWMLYIYESTKCDGIRL